MNTLYKWVPVALFSFVASTASAEDSIADIVGRSGGEFDQNYRDYDILLNAVIAADLVDALDDDSADLTVFAPNDLAFVFLARDLGFDGFDEEGAWGFLVATLTDLGGGDPIPLLTQFLLYHVAPESISVFDYLFLSIFGIPVDTLQGGTFQPFFFFLIDNEPAVRNPTLWFPLNVRASNGYVHTISRVLIPFALP